MISGFQPVERTNIELQVQQTARIDFILTLGQSTQTIEVSANAQTLKSLEGHTAWVQGVTFLAKGTRLASVGADETVRLWEMGEVKK